MFKNFYQLSKSEIASLVKKYLDETLFDKYPELKTDISVAISGSIASGHYDQHSDIDLDFYCKNQDNTDQFKEVISQFKKSISSDNDIPIQIHRLKHLALMADELGDYKNDSSLREIAQSIIVNDLSDGLAKLQEQFKWYPEDIAKEKLQWLYAQLVFEYEEHFKIAMERHDAFYIQVAKINTLRLAGNALLIANKEWPAYDKHLLASLDDALDDASILDQLNKVIKAEDIDLVSTVEQLVTSIEMHLAESGLIPKQNTKYWIDLRPSYSVSLG